MMGGSEPGFRPGSEYPARPKATYLAPTHHLHEPLRERARHAHAGDVAAVGEILGYEQAALGQQGRRQHHAVPPRVTRFILDLESARGGLGVERGYGPRREGRDVPPRLGRRHQTFPLGQNPVRLIQALRAQRECTVADRLPQQIRRHLTLPRIGRVERVNQDVRVDEDPAGHRARPA